MKKAAYVMIALIFIIGLGVFLYPYVYNNTYEKQSSEAISQFIALEEMLPNQNGDQEESGIVYPELYMEFEEYNKDLANGAQIALNSNTAYKKFPVSLKDYGFDNDMIGYISMPTIDMEQPLYLGASDANLKAGAAVMGYTSAPIGGENTNCVIAGHNYWSGAKRFKYIENLKEGDEIFLTTFWGQRKYIVTHMAVVDDHDFASIYIQTGKDMVTLMTCHKQNGVKMRYVVYCEFAE